jgi:hypothetical protein
VCKPTRSQCTPKLTITGLTSSSTPTNTLTSLNSYTSVTGSLSISDWNRATGTLLIDIPADIYDASVTDAVGVTTVAFDWFLTNPSKSQDSPGVQVELSYTGSSGRIPWGGLNGLNVVYEGGSSADLTHPVYPFRIKTGVLTSEIAQSSPYACDGIRVCVVCVRACVCLSFSSTHLLAH